MNRRRIAEQLLPLIGLLLGLHNGTVEEGKTANLAPLNANPLEDIRNTRKIDAGGIAKGKLLTRPDLDKLLQHVATKAAAAAAH